MPAPVISGVTLTSIPAEEAFFSGVTAAGVAADSMGAMASMAIHASAERARRKEEKAGETCIVDSLLRLCAASALAAFLRFLPVSILTCRKSMALSVNRALQSLTFKYGALIHGLHGASVIGKMQSVLGKLGY